MLALFGVVNNTNSHCQLQQKEEIIRSVGGSHIHKMLNNQIQEVPGTRDIPEVLATRNS